MRGPHTLHNFTWTSSQNTSLPLSGRAGLPTSTVIPGVDVYGVLAGLFSRRVERYWGFERLEMWTVEPTRAYVARVLGEEVSGYIEGLGVKERVGGWRVYMVIGILVSKGACEGGDE